MKRVIATSMVLALFAAACGVQGTEAPKALGQSQQMLVVQAAEDGLSRMNDALVAQGADVRVAYMEYITPADSGYVGNTVYAKNVGNKRLSSHFVPFDPNRREEGQGGDRYITFITDASEGAANGVNGTVSADETTAIVDSMVNVWDSQTCSAGLDIINFGAYNFDFGYVQYLQGFGGIPGWFADVTQAGWLKREFFDSLTPGCEKPDCGGDYILGVTFTFVWSGTDLDNNGRSDVAFREIYMNDGFTWRTPSDVWSGERSYDIANVWLHEMGHGLSQGHFGSVLVTDSNGKLHLSPRAVMNAVALRSSAERELLGTDTGGHCANWGSWPNN